MDANLKQLFPRKDKLDTFKLHDYIHDLLRATVASPFALRRVRLREKKKIEPAAMPKRSMANDNGNI